MKTIAPFQKLVDEYCRREGVLNNTYAYILVGKRINPLRSIEELGLTDDGDENVVESVLHAQGGNAETDEESEEKTITLKVRSAGEDISFKVKKTTPFRKIFKAYADRKGVAMKSYKFFIDGQRVNDDHTPKMLELVDDDIIDAMIDQEGGY